MLPTIGSHLYLERCKLETTKILQRVKRIASANDKIRPWKVSDAITLCGKTRNEGIRERPFSVESFRSAAHWAAHQFFLILQIQTSNLNKQMVDVKSLPAPGAYGVASVSFVKAIV